MNIRSAAVVMLFGALSFSTASLAASSCFTSSEAKAAHLRTLQQEFNVAALNCRSVDPNDPSIASRYNVFVTRFGVPLQANAQTLRSHFKRAGGNFDIWMTRVANDAGQRVITDPEYCQRASDILDKALALQNDSAVEDLAAETASYRMGVAECSDKAPPPVQHKTKSAKSKAKKHTVKATPASTASP